MSLTFSHDAFDEAPSTPPLWRDAVVGASVAAMAAAAGLGTHYEVGVAPWLATVTGALTAAALWGAHRQIGGVKPQRMAPRRAAQAPVARAKAPAPPELSTFSPRAVAAAPMAAPLAPPPLPTPLAVPPAATVASPAPAASAPVARATDAPSISPAAFASDIDPEAQFLHLQGLVRQLAAEVPGPRAHLPDPDRSRRESVDAAPPLSVGFARAGEIAQPRTAVPLEVPVAQASARSPLARLAEAVAAERFDVLLEPIQAIAEARVRHFEISLRFRDSSGETLPQDEVARLARNTGLSTSMDVLKLPRVAKIAQRVQTRGGTPADVLTLLAGSSLSDHHFMEAFAGAFPTGVPGPLVLSFAQADVRAFARVHWGALNALADMGLRFALADVSDLDMDFELLRARSFVFAKVEAEVFTNGLPCAGLLVPPSDLCRHLARAGLDVVVAGIDSETEMARLASYGISLGQGRLFGGARPVKSEVLR